MFKGAGTFSGIFLGPICSQIRSNAPKREGACNDAHSPQPDRLARRWKLSPRTLERWRWLGRGPRHVKVGARVLYRVEDVEAFEADGVRASTSAQQP